MRPTCFVGRVSDADFSRDALQGGEAERDGPVGRCVPGGYQHAAVYPLQARQDEFTRATRRHRVEGVVVCRIIRNGLSVADGFQQRKFEDGERRGTYVERELPADVFQPGKRSRIRFACLAAVAAEKRSPHFDEIRQRERERGLRSAIFDREVIAAFRRQREFGNMRESGDPQGIEVLNPVIPKGIASGCGVSDEASIRSEPPKSPPRSSVSRVAATRRRSSVLFGEKCIPRDPVRLRATTGRRSTGRLKWL